MRRSYLYAAALIVFVMLWMASGLLRSGAGPTEQAGTSAQNEPFAVEARWFTAQDFQDSIAIRGRTQALRSVILDSQIEATVEALPVERGGQVKQGDLICKLYEGDIPFRLAEAEALLEQRQQELSAAEDLLARGNQSRIAAAQARTQFESAKGDVAQWTVRKSFTRIKAPFDGFIEERPAEMGALLRIGDACARLIQTDPYLVVGEVTEAEVTRFDVGNDATIVLTDGQRFDGKVRFMSESADERTRTFRVEVAVPNPDNQLREGMSARLSIVLGQVRAHKLPAAILVLNTAGQIGVRAVDEINHVVFYPITLLGDPGEEIWVEGLPDRLQIITAGQDFIIDGEEVRILASDNRA